MKQVLQVPSGYLTVRRGKSPCLIGKPSISMGHGFHGELLNNQRVTLTAGEPHRKQG